MWTRAAVCSRSVLDVHRVDDTNTIDGIDPAGGAPARRATTGVPVGAPDVAGERRRRRGMVGPERGSRGRAGYQCGFGGLLRRLRCSTPGGGGTSAANQNRAPSSNGSRMVDDRGGSANGTLNSTTTRLPRRRMIGQHDDRRLLDRRGRPPSTTTRTASAPRPWGSTDRPAHHHAHAANFIRAGVDPRMARSVAAANDRGPSSRAEPADRPLTERFRADPADRAVRAVRAVSNERSGLSSATTSMP